MFSFILLALIIILFIKTGNMNDEIKSLSEKLNQLKEDYLNKSSFNQKEQTDTENKVMPSIIQQEPDKNKQDLNTQEPTPIYQTPSFEEQEIYSADKKEEISITPIIEEENIQPEESKKILPEFHFTTAKLFSWIAGFAFILAIIFGLIYAVQNEIISKQMITAAAGLIGLILLGAGLMIQDEKLKTAAGTLCASGIATFFIATYCSFALYEMININGAFTLMAAISFVSFYISVQKDMQFISFLGMIAAFITPLLLSSGNDNYIFFFIYIAFINGAAIAVSIKKGWNNLLISSLCFTFLCQLAWLTKDLTAQRVNIFQIIFTVYSIALTAVYINIKNKLPLFVKYVFSAFIILGAVMVLPLMIWLDGASGVLINLLILITISNALVYTLYYSEPDIFKIPVYIVSSVFLLSLLIWTGTAFATQTGGLVLLLAILGVSLANSLVVNAKTGEAFTTLINLLALFIVFIAITNRNLKLESLSFVHNGAIIFNLALFSVAYKFRERLTPLLKTSFGSYIVASLIFTFLFITQASSSKEFASVLTNIFIVDFALLFLAFKEKESYKLPLRFCSIAILVVLYYMLSVKGALLNIAFCSYLFLGAINLFANLQSDRKENAFVLILAAFWFISMFDTTNMYYIWFAAITLNVVCLSLARAYKKPTLILIAALGSSYLFVKAHDDYQIVISCVFFLLFFVFPFICKKDFEEESYPQWIASAYTGLVAWLIMINHSYFESNINKGLVALPFAALFLVNAVTLYKDTLENRSKAAFTVISMATMFFITAAISFIFTNEWLTLALAVEGATLIVLNKKVPTSTALNAKVGFILLLVAFVRLILIRNFFTYYTLDAKIFNWYLIVYSLSAAAMFVSAKNWISSDVNDKSIMSILNIAGAILLFFLINIEIANYFGDTGETLEFNFFGNFAATVTYTIAWTLYGAALCIIAFYKKHKILLNIGTVVMMLSIVKLFIFDLWSLGILYRIIGLFAIAGILFGISLIFQKFKDTLRE